MGRDDTKFECKLCFQQFDSLRQVYRHDMTTHLVNGTQRSEQGTKRRKISGNFAVRKRRKGAKMLCGEVNELLAELETEVREGLLNCADGMELNFLCRLFQPDPDNLLNLHGGIVNDLRTALDEDELAGEWDIQAFGSTVTGIAFRDSDIDFYIRPQFYNETFNRQFNRVHGLLARSRLFSKIIPIRTARVPILKCQHEYTGVNLDINLSSSFGVYNSRIISKLFISDSRIHPLMLVLKIWARSWDITKTGRMTNYCLILLVIFYLQNCPQPILQPLNFYQKNVKPQIINGINFAFNDTPPFRTRNRDNIKQLIIGFFKFYDELDYAKVIISPYLGTAINRFDFVSGTLRFPAYYQQLKVMSHILEENLDGGDWIRDIRGHHLHCQSLMVVQDPFCLNNNTSKAVSQQIFDLFKWQISHGNQICSEPWNPGQLLLRLFYEKSPNANKLKLQPINNAPSVGIQRPLPSATMNSLPAKPGVKKQLVNLVNVPTKAGKLQLHICRLTPMETELFYIRKYLREAFPSKPFNKTAIDKRWCKNAVEYIKNILTKLFQVTFNANGNGKNNAFNVNGELTAFADTWSQRKYDAKKGPLAFLKEQTDFGNIFTNGRVGTDRVIYCKLIIETDEINFSSITITMEPIAPSTKSALLALFKDLTSRIRVFFKAYFALEK